MLRPLLLLNFPSGYSPNLNKDHVFVMKTCQRTLVLHYDHLELNSVDSKNLSHMLKGESAYAFMLEVICGLQSKLIGENEIVSQFKEAYHNYIASSKKNTTLQSILEKLMKDGKQVRTEHLIGIAQKTYASITRKKVLRSGHVDKVLILGSGYLAEDLINQFKKKCEVVLCARNPVRVEELQEKHDLLVLPWDSFEKAAGFSHIVNTIGTDEILFNQSFFHNWTQLHLERVFVDLGSPSCLDTTYSAVNHVLRLEDILKEGATSESKKEEQIMHARKALELLTEKRSSFFRNKAYNRQNFLQSVAEHA